MARTGPKMRMRFRKSYTLIPGLLKWTLTKKGASLNLKLGPLSKSWGTGGRKRTTIDAPGEYGFQWIKLKRRGAGDTGSGRGWLWASLLVVVCQALVLAARHGLTLMADHPGEVCVSTGHSLNHLWLVLACELAVIALLWAQVKLRASLLALVMVVGSIAVWQLHTPQADCSTEHGAASAVPGWTSARGPVA